MAIRNDCAKSVIKFLGLNVDYPQITCCIIRDVTLSFQFPYTGVSRVTS